MYPGRAGHGEGRGGPPLISISRIFASLQLMIAALHLGVPRVAGVQEDIEVDCRILPVVQCFIDRFFRQGDHGPAKPTEHPCRQAILGFAHSSEMRCEWSGLQEEVSIKSSRPLINKSSGLHAKRRIRRGHRA